MEQRHFEIPISTYVTHWANTNQQVLLNTSNSIQQLVQDIKARSQRLNLDHGILKVSQPWSRVYSKYHVIPNPYL